MGELKPPALAAWVESRFGAIERAQQYGDATQADVWRVCLRSSETIVVKRPHDDATWARELAAYQSWVPRLGPSAPRLLAHVSAPVGALVLEWVDGVSMGAGKPDTTTRREMHRAAGRFVRALTAIEHADQDPISLEIAMALRLDRWCVRAERSLPPATIAGVRSAFDPDVFVGVPRIFAHRDFSPRNWICRRDPQPRLVVVDFGHARPDAPLSDLVKLWDRPWVRDPGCEDAFFDGFGRRLDDQEQAQLRQLCILHGLATAVWSFEHGDAEYAALGRSVLTRLGLSNA